MPQSTRKATYEAGAEHRCVGCGAEATRGVLCAACDANARADYLALSVEPDGSGYDPAVYEELAALEPKSFWFRSRSRVLVWAFRRYFPDESTFLEVGCGSGFTLASILSRLPHLSAAGGDVHAEGLRIARRRLPGVQLYRLDARELPFADAFDVVGAFDVLEHIPDHEEALAGMVRAVRPGGGVMLTVPQHPWLWSPADDAARHQRRYTRATMMALLAHAGLEPIRVTSFVSLLLPLMAAARIKASHRGSDFDFRDEFRIPPAVDRLCEKVLVAELALLRRGVSLPLGGSLLAVARRPA